MITAFISGLLAVAAVLTIIYVVIITAEWVTKQVKDRLAANEQHKIVFADLRETIDSEVKEKKTKQKEYPMNELEKMCRTAPYVIADYDMDTDEVVNYTGVNAEEIDADVKRRLKERGGLVVFHS